MKPSQTAHEHQPKKLLRNKELIVMPLSVAIYFADKRQSGVAGIAPDWQQQLGREGRLRPDPAALKRRA
ncbi:MAG TPA: hypothetical protein EYH07_19490 [Kiloniellaceae bacterium]|nr:hypothetical protein [Kiloniellaceae bacterium]HIP80631.1 hypothetical protein [Kiloniellaceae bacterium]